MHTNRWLPDLFSELQSWLSNWLSCHFHLYGHLKLAIETWAYHLSITYHTCSPIPYCTWHKHPHNCLDQKPRSHHWFFPIPSFTTYNLSLYLINSASSLLQCFPQPNHQGKEGGEFLKSFVAPYIRHCAKHFMNNHSFILPPAPCPSTANGITRQKIQLPLLLLFMFFRQILLCFLCQVILLDLTNEYLSYSRLSYVLLYSCSITPLGDHILSQGSYAYK